MGGSAMTVCHVIPRIIRLSHPMEHRFLCKHPKYPVSHAYLFHACAKPTGRLLRWSFQVTRNLPESRNEGITSEKMTTPQSGPAPSEAKAAAKGMMVKIPALMVTWMTGGLGFLIARTARRSTGRAIIAIKIGNTAWVSRK